MSMKIEGLPKHKQAIVSKVVGLVSDEFSVNSENLFKKSRAYKYSVPRMVATAILRSAYGIQYQAIAEYFGYKSHASVGHAVKDLEARMAGDKDLADIVKSIINKINETVK